jgi:hypothetical protein
MRTVFFSLYRQVTFSADFVRPIFHGAPHNKLAPRPDLIVLVVVGEVFEPRYIPGSPKYQALVSLMQER